jgi:hypothetical protein
VGPSKVKVKAEPKRKLAKGHAPGSHNFSLPEVHRLLCYINVRLPIGGKGWDVVTEKYNIWAKAKDYTQHTSQSIPA